MDYKKTTKWVHRDHDDYYLESWEVKVWGRPDQSPEWVANNFVVEDGVVKGFMDFMGDMQYPKVGDIIGRRSSDEAVMVMTPES